MSDSDEKKNPPSPEEIQKDLQDFFKSKFGNNVIISPMGVNPTPPTTEEVDTENNEELEERRKEALRFDRKPSEVKRHLDRFVIGQEEAKRSLAVAVCDHYNHARRAMDKSDEDDLDYVKQNVMLLGPTGVGKTYLIRTLAHLIGVPFVKADITKFSETGYVGSDVDDLVRELVRTANGDVGLAEYGIVFLDEIDKIASSGGKMLGRDVSGRGVQTGLLKLLEETEVPARSPSDISAQFQEFFQMRGGKPGKGTINTRHILFVVSGAFSGMDAIIEKRLTERNVGFGARNLEGEDDDAAAERTILSEVTTQDFVEYGFDPEFVGRLPIRVALNDLTQDDLFQVLTASEGSILKQHSESFHGYDIDVEFTDDALRAVAARAKEEQTGARGLVTVLESVLRNFKFSLPDTTLGRFLVTKEVVAHPATSLQSLLDNPGLANKDFESVEVKKFEREFEHEHGVRLDLDPAAVTMATAVAAEIQIPVREYLYNTFRDHLDFMKKVRSNTGRKRFPVTPMILNRPGEGVTVWLQSEEDDSATAETS